MKNQVVLSKKLFVSLMFWCLFSAGLFLTTFFYNFAEDVAAKDSSGSDRYTYLKVFTDVLALVQKNYVKEVDFKEIMEGAIKGMLMSLDPHSSYLNPENFKDLQVDTKGEFGGLGIEITIKDGLLTVIAPIDESPAFNAGIKAGDKLIKIGDEFAKDMTLMDAVKKMRGPKGSTVTVSVAREKVPGLIPINIIRDVVKVKSVRARMLDDGFGYVRLAQFQEGSSQEFTTALKILQEKNKGKNLSGLVVDLRNNHGGLLTEAIRVADIFLKDGLIVSTDGRLESQKNKNFAHNDGAEPSYPVIVLVNEGSASAAEIFAGAMQDDKRGLILGTQTFGKGSVQTVIPMEDGAALRLTTALYYTKSGRAIQAKGVVPDVVIEEKPAADKQVQEHAEKGDESLSLIKEKDLPRAIKNPADENSEDSKNKDSKKKESSSKKESTIPNSKTNPPTKLEQKTPLGSKAFMEMDLNELLGSDTQLREALRLLKTWHVFKGKPGDIQANLTSSSVSL